MLVWSWITFSITFDINGTKDIGLQLDASVKEPFLYIGFSFAILQESGNFPEVIDRFHNSVVPLAKTFAPSFKKRPEGLSKPAALDTLAFFIVVKMVLSETVARLKK